MTDRIDAARSTESAAASGSASVTRRGALDMQVCVPSDWTDEQVKAFADTKNLCGTQHGWQIRREGSVLLAGMKERKPCNQRSRFVHIMLDA